MECGRMGGRGYIDSPQVALEVLDDLGRQVLEHLVTTHPSEVSSRELVLRYGRNGSERHGFYRLLPPAEDERQHLAVQHPREPSSPRSPKIGSRTDAALALPGESASAAIAYSAGSHSEDGAMEPISIAASSHCGKAARASRLAPSPSPTRAGRRDRLVNLDLESCLSAH